MEKDSKIFIAGRAGLVGSAIERNLRKKGFTNIIGTVGKTELDFKDETNVKYYLQFNKPDYVFLASAKVGGIHANNTYPVEFLLDNLQIQNNIIKHSYINNVKKLLFVGSSCIYPKDSKIPITEDKLLTGYLEPTNEAYAIAKIAGIKLCQAYKKEYGANFISAMPTNLAGIGDNFDPENSHVIPGMLKKFHDAKINNQPTVKLWGSGNPMREFMLSDDMADACVFLMENYNDLEIVNIGTGVDVTLKELAQTIRDVVEYNGNIEWDTSKPDGMFRKVMSIEKLKNLGWKIPNTTLKEIVEVTYNDAYYKNKL